MRIVRWELLLLQQMGNERFAMTMLDLGYGQSTAKTRRGGEKPDWSVGSAVRGGGAQI